MSPKILEAGPYIFWFHSYDARFENRISDVVRRMTKTMPKSGWSQKSNWPALVVGYAGTNCGLSWQLLKRIGSFSWRNGMVTNVALVDEKIQIKRYKIQHSVSDYTFPEEALIHQVEVDDAFLHAELADSSLVDSDGLSRRSTGAAKV